ncbi:hypothetical protein DY000_02063191 [Brassica cretica]|uniref:Galactose oxidase-like Early set domain-containing protein n=1 Tax=Brassica cretica TaxID=69181 RepID=A0ABQ7B3S1_BRACR|nr:hypothetical protein DY000_02063191 [Brassica cretica]
MRIISMASTIRPSLLGCVSASPRFPVVSRNLSRSTLSFSHVTQSKLLTLRRGVSCLGVAESGKASTAATEEDLLKWVRLQKYSPPYLDPALANLRPTIVNTATPKQIRYGERFNIRIHLNQKDVTKENVKVTMLAPPFTTHAVSMNMRLLILGIFDIKKEVRDLHQIHAIAPPSGKVAPPGYYLLFVVYNGVPSVGEWIQIV